MTKYAGADWIENLLKHRKPDVKLSRLGRDVADFLGELYYGIYHLDPKALSKAEWNADHTMSVVIGWRADWSTYDFDYLTRLVFLAHHMCLRVELKPVAPNHMRVYFSRRQRGGRFHERHPDLEDAVNDFRRSISFPPLHQEESITQ